MVPEAQASPFGTVRARKTENRNSARDFVWVYLAAHPCEVYGEKDPLFWNSTTFTARTNPSAR